jgi:hypothetical protein
MFLGKVTLEAETIRITALPIDEKKNTCRMHEDEDKTHRMVPRSMLKYETTET